MVVQKMNWLKILLQAGHDLLCLFRQTCPSNTDQAQVVIRDQMLPFMPFENCRVRMAYLMEMLMQIQQQCLVGFPPFLINSHEGAQQPMLVDGLENIVGHMQLKGALEEGCVLIPANDDKAAVKPLCQCLFNMTCTIP